MPRPPPPKLLLVCEKPAAAECLAAALLQAGIAEEGASGSTRELLADKKLRHLLHLNGPPAWRFEGRYWGRPAIFTVTSVKGHLSQLEFDSSHRGWYDKDIEELLLPCSSEAERRPHIEDENVAVQLFALAREGCDELVLWLDCDPEGEAICLEVMETVGNAVTTVRRAVFASLHPPDLCAALECLVEPNLHLAASVRVREELDLRFGYAYTRLLTMLCRTRCHAALAEPQLQSGQVAGSAGNRLYEQPPSQHWRKISFGPCQTPALYLVCQRNEARLDAAWKEPDTLELELELDVNIPGAPAAEKVACTVVCSAGSSGSDIQELKLLQKRFSRPELQAAEVRVSSQPWSLPKPLPPRLVAVQQRASRELKMSPSRLDFILEELYLNKFITYPRTESAVFPDHFDADEQDALLRSLIDNYRQSSGKEEVTICQHSKRLLGSRSAPRTDGPDAWSQEPIRPRGQHQPWYRRDGDEVSVSVWQLLVRMTLAALSPDAIGLHYTVEVTLAGTEATFRTEGFIAEEDSLSWLDILEPEKDTVMLPQGLRHLSSGPLNMRTLSARMTKSFLPPELTEAELLARMEVEKIGTDASAGVHVAKLLERGYAVIHPVSRVIEPLPLGRAMILAFLGGTCRQLVDPSARARMEARCHDIAEKKAKNEQVLKNTLHKMHRDFISFAREAENFLVLFQLGLIEAQKPPLKPAKARPAFFAEKLASTRADAIQLPEDELRVWSTQYSPATPSSQSSAGMPPVVWWPIRLADEASYSMHLKPEEQRLLECYKECKRQLAGDAATASGAAAAAAASAASADDSGDVPSNFQGFEEGRQVLRQLQSFADFQDTAYREGYTGPSHLKDLTIALEFLLLHDKGDPPMATKKEDGWYDVAELLATPLLARHTIEDLQAVARERINETRQPRFEMKDRRIRVAPESPAEGLPLPPPEQPPPLQPPPLPPPSSPPDRNSLRFAQNAEGQVSPRPVLDRVSSGTTRPATPPLPRNVQERLRRRQDGGTRASPEEEEQEEEEGRPPGWPQPEPPPNAAANNSLPPVSEAEHPDLQRWHRRRREQTVEVEARTPEPERPPPPNSWKRFVNPEGRFWWRRSDGMRWFFEDDPGPWVLNWDADRELPWYQNTDAPEELFIVPSS